MTETAKPEYTEGEKYRVIYNDGGRKPKQIIAVYLGVGGPGGSDYLFDGRPQAGTVSLRIADVTTMIVSGLPVNPIPHPVGTNMGGR